MKNFIVALSLMFILTPSIVQADWTKMDTALEFTYAALVVLDWGQTSHIAKNPLDHEEMNPILGAQPSLQRVNLYFPSMIIIHAAISYILPGDFRRIWQCITVGVQGGAVYRNFSRGIYLDFSLRF